MDYLTQALALHTGCTFTYGLIKGYGTVHLLWTSPRLLLPGPKSKSTLWGSHKEIRGSDNRIDVQNTRSLLVKANMAGRCSVMWTSWRLPSAHSRLREECLDLPSDSPSLDDLNFLVYLDCMVKEVMCVYAPVPNMDRAAVQNDVFPLDGTWVDKRGVKHHSIKPIHVISRIRVAKGDSGSVLIGWWPGPSNIETGLQGHGTILN
ncbi:hypothetical protein FIBSPDRAFT_883821 [Athelia psychrophila]|uniref:Uncharacterized protein n=1 Tax=Athelia psychrophila TaxID=1759441 RepID=A0A166TJG3_9AGAM|nr:hypothetical protein FIBSPDRAFT_883821 [Fibularhizoctonia sp. CBS 109695]